MGRGRVLVHKSRFSKWKFIIWVYIQVVDLEKGEVGWSLKMLGLLTGEELIG